MNTLVFLAPPALASAEWLQANGVLALLTYALLYIVGSLVAFPSTLLTASAGFAFGPVLGTLLVSPVSTLAATVAFVIARRFGARVVSPRLAADPRLAAIGAAVRQRAALMVFLLRLSPVLPFTALNYGLGLTGITLRTYVLASWIGMLPGTALYVYLGSAIPDASALLAGRGERTAAEIALFWGGLAATAFVSVALTLGARRALRRALQENASK